MLDFTVKMARATVCSKIDLRKGCHQILVHPADITKMAVTIPFSIFEEKRMPLGQRNSCATFQRQMDRVTERYGGGLHFVDDRLVANRGRATLQDLKQFLGC
jgi:hypothetical protein